MIFDLTRGFLPPATCDGGHLNGFVHAFSLSGMSFGLVVRKRSLVSGRVRGLRVVNPDWISFVFLKSGNCVSCAKLFRGLSRKLFFLLPTFAFCANSLALTLGRVPNLFLFRGKEGGFFCCGGGPRLNEGVGFLCNDGGISGWGGGPKSNLDGTVCCGGVCVKVKGEKVTGGLVVARKLKSFGDWVSIENVGGSAENGWKKLKREDSVETALNGRKELKREDSVETSLKGTKLRLVGDTLCVLKSASMF